MESQIQKLSPAGQAAQNYGIDLSLLDMCLQRSPTERILAHQDALALAEELQEAGRRVRENAQC